MALLVRFFVVDASFSLVRVCVCEHMISVKSCQVSDCRTDVGNTYG